MRHADGEVSDGGAPVSTGPRQSWQDALESSRRFAALFEGCYDRWTVAGSVRRKRPDVGDVEHVVIPAWLKGLAEPGLFGAVTEPPMVNAVWARMATLVVQGTMEKAPNEPGDDEEEEGEPRYCWGEKQRRVLFEGIRHEVFMASPENYGPILAIRTGPGPFSKGLVSRLKGGGRYRQQDGFLVYASGQSAGQRRACPDEAEYLRLCGVPWIEPEKRDTFVV